MLCWLIVSNVLFYLFFLKRIDSKGIFDFLEPRETKSPRHTMDGDVVDVIKFKQIVDWHILIQLFEYQAKKKQGKVTVTFPGVEVSAIICSPTASCANLNVSFQPRSLQLIGGVCGIDIVPTFFQGSKARIYLLPQLYIRAEKEASEGPRGLIASSTGVVFDVAGGCEACISVVPMIGDQMVVRRNLLRSFPIVVSGLHSHSSTYFHTVHELFPRLYLVMDYIHNHFNDAVDNLQLSINIRSNYEILNSYSEMMGWGLISTLKNKNGSFLQTGMHTFIEGVEHIISSIPVKRDWHPLLQSVRPCIAKKLLRYKGDREDSKCPPKDLPKDYILIIPRIHDKARTLLNHTAMIEFLLDSFDIPLVVPDLRYGCDLNDNVRFFKNAIGFLSPHGAAFTNIPFMQTPGIIIQFVPNSAHPFNGAANSYTMMGKRLGHLFYTMNIESSKEPRWDMTFRIEILLKIICGKIKGEVKELFDLWRPTKELKVRCLEFVAKQKLRAQQQ